MKIFVSLFILIILVTQVSYADTVIIQEVTVTIVVDTKQEESRFDFYLFDSRYAEFIDDFQVQTGPNEGRYTFSLMVPFLNNDYYYKIYARSSNGWRLVDVQCDSDNTNNSAEVVNVLNTDLAQVHIKPQEVGNVTCIFSNQKILEEATPVLIIPGVLGSDVYKGSEKLWLDLMRNFRDVGDQFMDPLQFDDDLTPLDTSLQFSDVIRKETVDVGIGEITIFDYIYGLFEEFKAQGYVPGENLFTFPYDWRDGVSDKNIVALKGQIDYILGKTGSDKVDVVAHSTGGLLLKKYVLENESSDVHKAVLVGVPNIGAPKAIKVLLEGDGFGIPWLADGEMKKIARNLPVVYDLSPSKKYYTSKGSYVKVINNKNFGKDEIKYLNFEEVGSFLIGDHNLNSLAVNASANLHNSIFDEFDMRDKGVDVYNIVGCKTDSIGSIIEKRSRNIFNESYVSYDVSHVPGDGTVPLESATNVPVDESKKFYALETDHSRMLSQEGIRPLIVNLTTGSQLAVGNKITQDLNRCKLNGKAIAIYSPLTLEITDSTGRVAKLDETGSVYNNIPNVGFTLFGEQKFIFLPDDEGQTYNVKVVGTGDGFFTLKSSSVVDDKVVFTDVFVNLPVTSNLEGVFDYKHDIPTLALDLNGDGEVEKTIEPSSKLNGDQSEDYLSPVTTAEVQEGRGVVLKVEDVVEEGREEEVSGVLKTVYSLDGGEYEDYSTSTPIMVTEAGNHALRFYSVDRAGNNEVEQILEFTVAVQGNNISEAGGGGTTSGAGGPVPVPQQNPAEFRGPQEPMNGQTTGQVLGESVQTAHGEGSLIVDADGTVYLIENSAKRPFTSAWEFLKLGYRFKDVVPFFPGDSSLLLGMVMGMRN